MTNQLNDDQIRNSELDEIRNSGLKENNALRVHTYLRANERARSRRLPRWIWELLQNALDASTAHDDPLTVKIEYNREELVFLHNGSSFKAKQIFNLIYHGSTKTDEEETIGEYGSGFLTTHLLSPEIKVSGQLDNKQWFDFHLTRKSDSSDVLLDLMDEAWENFKGSLSTTEQSTPNPFTTRFIYPIIGADAEEAVKKGIETLKQCTPFVVVFNSKLSSIDINNYGEMLRFQVIERHSIDAAEIQHITVATHVNGNSSENKYILISDEKKTSVAAPLGLNNNGSVCQPVKKIPRLFKAFPLVGTESFSFPAVINSLDFEPSEDRDDVYIGLGNDEANTKNQAVIEESYALLARLLQYAASEGWHHVHQWAEVPTLQHPTEETWRWLKTRIKEKFIGTIHQIPIILTQSGKPVEPDASLLPVAENDEGIDPLWNLLHDWSGCDIQLPRQDEAIGWYKAIKSWAEVLECEVLEISGAIDGERVARSVHNLSHNPSDNTHRVSNLKKIKKGISVINWLDRLFGFLQNHGLSEVVDKYNIVPNQAELLCLSSSLFRDIGVHEELKNIAELLGWHVRCELRDNQLTSLAEEAGAGVRNSENIVESLIRMLQERVSQVISSQNPGANFKQAAQQLFAWLVHQNQQNYWSHLSDVPILTKDGIYHPSLSSVMLPNNPPLAPIRAWPEDLQQFSELFPPDRILDDSFFKAIPDSDLWQMLCEQNFTRRNMIRRWDDLTDLKPFSPEIYENEDDGRDHESKDAFSAIGVVTSEAIMEKVRNSRDSAYLFWRFLIFLTELIEEKTDGAYLDEKSVQCKFCGKIHKYYPSIWLKAVRSNKWIRDGDSRFHADAPSLAKLLREKGWDLGSLENPSTLKLLTAINVSPSDLRLELIAGDPETRDILVSTMTELHQITGGDLSQVHTIVQHVQKVDGDLSQTLEVIQHMQEDANFSEYLAERQKQARRIHKNQHLGTQVENLVKENLEQKNFEGKGFTVEPTGKGSDFEMEDTEGIITLNVAQENQKWLIEVKATRTEGDHQSVRMTSTQAQTAVKKKEKFLLCVVPLGREAVGPETVRENMHFIQNIGDSIAPLWEGLKSLKKKPADIDIILDVEERKAGILVKKSVWENDGFPLEKLAEHLK